MFPPMSIEEFPISTETSDSLATGTPELTGATKFFFWLSSVPKTCTLAAIKAAMAIIPNGGTSGQVLTKTNSSDGVVHWATPSSLLDGGVPDGGTTGQVLAKASDTDQDLEWVDVAGGGDGGGGGGDPIIPIVPEGEMLAGAIASYNGHLYMATADTEITAAPSPTGESGVNPDLLHVGPAWPRCTLRLPYGVLIDATPGTALSAQLFSAADYTRDTNFKGAITIGGDPPQDGTAGDVVFSPGDSSKTYEVEIFGSVYNDAAGTAALFWPMNSGGNGMYAQGAQTSGAGSAPIVSAVKRMPGAWGATGALQSAGDVDSAIDAGLTIVITQRDN